MIYKCIYNYHTKETFTPSINTPSNNIINVLITQADGSIAAIPCISTYCSINCNIKFLTPGSSNINTPGSSNYSPGSSNYSPGSSNYSPSPNSTDPVYTNNTSGTCILIPK